MKNCDRLGSVRVHTHFLVLPVYKIANWLRLWFFLLFLIFYRITRHSAAHWIWIIWQQRKKSQMFLRDKIFPYLDLMWVVWMGAHTRWAQTRWWRWKFPSRLLILLKDLSISQPSSVFSRCSKSIKERKNQFKSITHLDGDRRMRWLAKQLIVLSRTYREINFIFVNLVEYRAVRKRW